MFVSYDPVEVARRCVKFHTNILEEKILPILIPDVKPCPFIKSNARKIICIVAWMYGTKNLNAYKNKQAKVTLKNGRN